MVISAFFCFVFLAWTDFIKTWKGQRDMKRRSTICGEIKPHITNRAVVCPKDTGLSRQPARFTGLPQLVYILSLSTHTFAYDGIGKVWVILRLLCLTFNHQGV